MKKHILLEIKLLNFNDLKQILGEVKLANEIKNNIFYNIIQRSKNLKIAQKLFEDKIYLRFSNKEIFSDNLDEAIKFTISIAQAITDLNFELYKHKNIYLKFNANMTFVDENNKLKIGFNTFDKFQTFEKKIEIFSNFRISLDEILYNLLKKNYKFSQYKQVQINSKEYNFFVLNLDKILIYPTDDETPEEMFSLKSIPTKNIKKTSADIDEEQTIKTKCQFIKADCLNLQNIITNINDNNNNYFALIKTNESLGFSENLNTDLITNREKSYLTLDFEDNFEPLSFFRRILKSFYIMTDFDVYTDEYDEFINTISNESMIAGKILKLINSDIDIKETDYVFAGSIIQLFGVFPPITFIIDHFEYIDKTSLKILKYIIEDNSMYNASIIGFYDKSEELLKKFPSFILYEKAFHIDLLEVDNSLILKDELSKFEPLKESFVFQKIIENINGSKFYYNELISFLEMKNVLQYRANCFYANEENLTAIPSTISNIIISKLKILFSKKNIFENYLKLILCGNIVPIYILKEISSDFESSLNFLKEKNFIKIENNYIYLQHFILYKKCIYTLVNKQELQQICQKMFENLEKFLPPHHYIMINLLLKTDNAKKHTKILFDNAQIAISFGDFSVYANCYKNILNIIDEKIKTEPEKKEDLTQLKIEFFNELVENLYKYEPEIVVEYFKPLIAEAYKKNDFIIISKLYNRLTQTCLYSNDYINADKYINKLIAVNKLVKSDNNEMFYYINTIIPNLVYIEILFTLGKFNSLIGIFNQTINIINETKLINLEKQFSDKKNMLFISSKACILYILANIVQLNFNICEQFEDLKSTFKLKEIDLKLLKAISSYIFNKNYINIEQNEINIEKTDSYYTQLLYFINQMFNPALNNIEKAQIANTAKYFAQKENNEFFGLIFDMAIAQIYIEINKPQKAISILSDIKKTSENKKYFLINLMTYYYITKAYYKMNEFATATKLANQSIVVLAKDKNISPMFSYIFKKLLSELFKQIGNDKNAKIFEEQTKEIEKLFFNQNKKTNQII